MAEDFYEAAIRHFVDGRILEMNECYDNALYLFGYAAECSLKCIMSEYLSQSSNSGVRGYNHNILELFENLNDFTGNDGIVSEFDPALGLKLQNLSFPEALSRNHPERRYLSNGQFNEKDVKECERVVEFLIKEMISLQIDGYL